MEGKTATAQAAMINSGRRYQTVLGREMFRPLGIVGCIPSVMKGFLDFRRSMLNLRNMKNY